MDRSRPGLDRLYIELDLHEPIPGEELLHKAADEIQRLRKLPSEVRLESIRGILAQDKALSEAKDRYLEVFAALQSLCTAVGRAQAYFGAYCEFPMVQDEHLRSSELISRHKGQDTCRT
jgi:hypothetical protein